MPPVHRSIWLTWSARGSKYWGRREIEQKWRSFKRSGVTSRSLARIAGDHGAPLDEIAIRHNGPDPAIGREPEICHADAGRRQPVRRDTDPEPVDYLNIVRASQFASRNPRPVAFRCARLDPHGQRHVDLRRWREWQEPCLQTSNGHGRRNRRTMAGRMIEHGNVPTSRPRMTRSRRISVWRNLRRRGMTCRRHPAPQIAPVGRPERRPGRGGRQARHHEANSPVCRP